jgi:HEPN domain-containing protein
MKNRLDHVRGWLKKGDSDLHALRILIQYDGPSDIACFHAQQAVEKYLKGLLAYLSNDPIPRTHDIEELQSNCLQFVYNSELERLCLSSLTDFGVTARYDFDFDPDIKMVKEALNLVENIRRIVQSHLPSGFE